MKRIGLYPGTFDPITLGHVDIIRRACALVDRLVIGIAINRDKGPLFDLDERVAMVEAESAPLGAAATCCDTSCSLATAARARASIAVAWFCAVSTTEATWSLKASTSAGS